MNSAFGLTEEDFTAIKSVVQKHQKINTVILFGSRAMGTHRNGSDIDLALMGNQLELNDLLALSADFDDLDLPYQFDVIDYNRIEEQGLIEHINRVGVEIFKR